MKIKDESCTIVLIGNWNKYILSPGWSAKNIFNEPKLQVEIALDLGLPPRYTSEQTHVRMIPAADNVTFVALQNDNECLSSYGCQFTFNSVRRRLIVQNRTLNLAISQKGREIIFDFNFHYDVAGTEEVKAKIKNSIVENKKIAENLLKSVYNLDCDKLEIRG